MYRQCGVKECVIQIFNCEGTGLFYKNLFFFGTTNVVSQGLSVPLVGLVFSDLLITHSRIVSPTYGGTVHTRLEPKMGILLSHTS